ncbi:MAG: hypothetical protein CMF46_04120 [Legionellales bacterium]|nr:hypothetical protein [Legionellales bacterium]
MGKQDIFTNIESLLTSIKVKLTTFCIFLVFSTRHLIGCDGEEKFREHLARVIGDRLVDLLIQRYFIHEIIQVNELAGVINRPCERSTFWNCITRCCDIWKSAEIASTGSNNVAALEKHIPRLKEILLELASQAEWMKKHNESAVTPELLKSHVEEIYQITEKLVKSAVSPAEAIKCSEILVKAVSDSGQGDGGEFKYNHSFRDTVWLIDTKIALEEIVRTSNSNVSIFSRIVIDTGCQTSSSNIVLREVSESFGLAYEG